MSQDNASGRNDTRYTASGIIGRLRTMMFGSTLLFCFLMGVVGMFPSLTEASLHITVHNETGYDLSEVKYVQEMGNVKSLAGRTQQLANGGSHTFDLNHEGAYRIYASFIMSGKKVYAKGNANNLQDGGRYTLTLQKVVFSQHGASLNFIGQSEFDAIK